MIQLLHKFWLAGYTHGDCHIDNIVIFETPKGPIAKFIDFEYVHHRRKKDFFEDIDMKGGGFVHCFDGTGRSIKNCLGVTLDECKQWINE